MDNYLSFDVEQHLISIDLTSVGVHMFPDRETSVACRPEPRTANSFFAMRVEPLAEELKLRASACKSDQTSNSRNIDAHVLSLEILEQRLGAGLSPDERRVISSSVSEFLSEPQSSLPDTSSDAMPSSLLASIMSSCKPTPSATHSDYQLISQLISSFVSSARENLPALDSKVVPDETHSWDALTAEVSNCILDGMSLLPKREFRKMLTAFSKAATPRPSKSLSNTKRANSNVKSGGSGGVSVRHTLQRILEHFDGTHDTTLIEACKLDRTDIVPDILDFAADRKALIDAPGGLGETPLMVATQLGLANTVRCLVKHNADVDRRNAAKMTPLLAACDLKKTPIAQQLIALNANLEGTNATGISPLAFAAMRRCRPIVALLVRAGARVDEPRDARGFTPLIYASCVGAVDVMKTLLTAKADPLAVSKEGSNALMYALHASKIAAVRTLLDVPAVAATLPYSPALHMAATQFFNVLDSYSETQAGSQKLDKLVDIAHALARAGCNPQLTVGKETVWQIIRRCSARYSDTPVAAENAVETSTNGQTRRNYDAKDRIQGQSSKVKSQSKAKTNAKTNAKAKITVKAKCPNMKFVERLREAISSGTDKRHARGVAKKAKKRASSTSNVKVNVSATVRATPSAKVNVSATVGKNTTTNNDFVPMAPRGTPKQKSEITKTLALTKTSKEKKCASVKKNTLKGSVKSHEKTTASQSSQAKHRRKRRGKANKNAVVASNAFSNLQEKEREETKVVRIDHEEKSDLSFPTYRDHSLNTMSLTSSPSPSASTSQSLGTPSGPNAPNVAPHSHAQVTLGVGSHTPPFGSTPQQPHVPSNIGPYAPGQGHHFAPPSRSGFQGGGFGPMASMFAGMHAQLQPPPNFLVTQPSVHSQQLPPGPTSANPIFNQMNMLQPPPNSMLQPPLNSAQQSHPTSPTGHLTSNSMQAGASPLTPDGMHAGASPLTPGGMLAHSVATGILSPLNAQAPTGVPCAHIGVPQAHAGMPLPPMSQNMIMQNLAQFSLSQNPMNTMGTVCQSQRGQISQPTMQHISQPHLYGSANSSSHTPRPASLSHGNELPQHHAAASSVHALAQSGDHAAAALGALIDDFQARLDALRVSAPKSERK